MSVGARLMNFEMYASCLCVESQEIDENLFRILLALAFRSAEAGLASYTARIAVQQNNTTRKPDQQTEHSIATGSTDKSLQDRWGLLIETSHFLFCFDLLTSITCAQHACQFRTHGGASGKQPPIAGVFLCS